MSLEDQERYERELRVAQAELDRVRGDREHHRTRAEKKDAKLGELALELEGVKEELARMKRIETLDIKVIRAATTELAAIYHTLSVEEPGMAITRIHSMREWANALEQTIGELKEELLELREKHGYARSESYDDEREYEGGGNS